MKDKITSLLNIVENLTDKELMIAYRLSKVLFLGLSVIIFSNICEEMIERYYE